MSKLALTDLYQLTMAQAYIDNGKADDIVTFEYFIRSMPQDWGYFIVCGVDKLIRDIIELEMDLDELRYLDTIKTLKTSFIDYLDNFQFTGNIKAINEGTPVFSNEPIIQITAPLIQAQLLETFILNQMNFQIMIASKASRIVNAAKGKPVVDFGLRRAHGEEAGVLGARACYIGGCVATSNVKAGIEYGIPISGTHAHSFVMSFYNELDAFRAYAKSFPNNTTLLIDTYDTYQGAKNAVIVAKEMESRGEKLNAVRIDSGDFFVNVPDVRRILNESGLNYVNIVLSNDLNEYKIEKLLESNIYVDSFGVGTEMITAKPTAAISGVYKLVEYQGKPVMKKSEGKITHPGKKHVLRMENSSTDILTLDGDKRHYISVIPLLTEKIRDGIIVAKERNLEETRNYSIRQVAQLNRYLKQLQSEDKGRVLVSKEIKELEK